MFILTEANRATAIWKVASGDGGRKRRTDSEMHPLRMTPVTSRMSLTRVACKFTRCFRGPGICLCSGSGSRGSAEISERVTAHCRAVRLTKDLAQFSSHAKIPSEMLPMRNKVT